MRAYWMFYWLVRITLSLYFRIRVSGLENVPRQGAALVIANHRSGFDPPMVGAVMPRPVHFMAKVELFSYPLLPLIFKYVQAYPVRRGHPDRKAIRHSLEILQQGEAIVLFPEGHRTETGDLQEARSGVVFLAQKSGCQLLPIGISGRYGFRRTIRYVIGPPFHIPPDMDKKSAQALVMTKIGALVQEGQAIENGSTARA